MDHGEVVGGGLVGMEGWGDGEVVGGGHWGPVYM